MFLVNLILLAIAAGIIIIRIKFMCGQRAATRCRTAEIRRRATGRRCGCGSGGSVQGSGHRVELGPMGGGGGGGGGSGRGGGGGRGSGVDMCMGMSVGMSVMMRMV